MIVTPQHGPPPATFDRRAYLIDRLYALWWTVIFEGASHGWAREQQDALVDELRTLPE